MPCLKEDKLTDQINIPITPKLKRRIVKLAESAENRPKPTHYARMLLEEAVGHRESKSSKA